MGKKTFKTPSSCLDVLFIFRGFGSPVLPCQKVKNKSTKRGVGRDYVTGAPCERGGRIRCTDWQRLGGKTVGKRGGWGLVLTLCVFRRVYVFHSKFCVKPYSFNTHLTFPKKEFDLMCLFVYCSCKLMHICGTVYFYVLHAT